MKNPKESQARRRRFYRQVIEIGLIVSVVFVLALSLWIHNLDNGSTKSKQTIFKELRKEKKPGAVDVVLIVVDTLRADYTSPYGSSKPTTPFLKKLAHEGVTFTNAFAPAPWTVPSMHSMMTGLYPSEHGMVGKKQAEKVEPVLSEEALTMAEVFQSNGYETYGICTNASINSRFGFSQGFDHFIGRGFAFLPFPQLAVDSIAQRARRSSKYFLWLHYFDPHQPYFSHSPWFEHWNESKFKNYLDITNDMTLKFYRQRYNLGPNEPLATEDVFKTYRIMSVASLKSFLPTLYRMFRKFPGYLDKDYRKFIKAAYMSDIRATDEAIKETFSKLGIDDQTLVIFTSDHGEELFDHQGLGHHTGTLYQELIRIPLVIRLPGGKAAGKVIDTPVSLIDLFPTVFEILDIDVPGDVSGKSFAALFDEKKMPSRPLFAEVNDISGHAVAILEYPWKYIHNFNNRSGQLFNLLTDPNEKTNLIERENERAKKMQSRLHEWMQTTKERWPAAKPATLTPEDIRRLEQMGYMRKNN